MVVTNRKEIEDLVYKVFDALDPSGMNTTKYKKILGDMSEEQFAKWLKDFLETDKTAGEISVKLNQLGLEVENSVPEEKLFDKIVVGHCIGPHPGLGGKVLLHQFHHGHILSRRIYPHFQIVPDLLFQLAQ